MNSDSKDSIYTDVPSSSIMQQKPTPPRSSAVADIIQELEVALKSIESSHLSSFRSARFIETNDTFNNKLKQYLYNLNLFLEQTIKTHISKTSKKSLLFTSIFNIINICYQLIDLIDDDYDTQEITDQLNTALLGYTINNIKILYEDTIKRTRSKE